MVEGYGLGSLPYVLVYRCSTVSESWRCFLGYLRVEYFLLEYNLVFWMFSPASVLKNVWNSLVRIIWNSSEQDKCLWELLWRSLKISPFSQTESKAFSRSNKAAPISSRLCIFMLSSDDSLCMACMVEYWHWNPNWLLGILFRHFINDL